MTAVNDVAGLVPAQNRVAPDDAGAAPGRVCGPSAASWERRLVRRVALTDALAILVGVVGAELIRFGVQSSDAVGGVPYQVVAAVLVPVWVLALGAGRCYEPRFLGAGGDDIRRVFDTSARVAITLILASYVAHFSLSRGFLGLAVPGTTALLLVGRLANRRWLARQRRAGRAMRRALLVGSGGSVVHLLGRLRRDPGAGFTPVGVCIPEPRRAVSGVRVVGTPHAVVDALIDTQADSVIVTASDLLPADDLRRLAWRLEGTGIDLIVAPALTDVAGPRITVRPVAGLTLLHIEQPELGSLRRSLKRVVERVAALIAVVALAPLTVAIALAVRLTSHGPAMFVQTRVGLGGREFRIRKFRSMYANAEQRLAELQHLNEHDGLLFKIRNDPRVTPVGRWLRRFSLDELPQLWNVVRGDMALVGPRPPLPCEVERYGDDVRRRLLVRPGLTGLWQVSGRADLSWEESVRLDLFYVENWSVALDLQILWRTVAAVLRGSGAY